MKRIMGIFSAAMLALVLFYGCAGTDQSADGHGGHGGESSQGGGHQGH